MSLILDALKRAERERQGDAMPSPREVPAVLVRPAPRVGRSRDLAGAVIIVAGLGLAAFLLWDAFRARPAPSAAPGAQTNVIVARPAPPEAPPAVVPGTESVASLDDLTDEDALEAAASAPAPAKPAPAKPVPAPTPVRPSSTSIATPPAPPPTAAPPAQLRATAQPPSQAPATTAPTPPAAPAPAPVAAPAASAEIPPALTRPAPLRKFREMPPDYRADFPALRVEIHVYEKDPARRFVMVNGRRYKEGERMAEGPALVEIVPDGVVLEYRGEKVLYSLGR
ncbi:MAG: general secretion pathway protein GspB [Gammaproteobacteria bacterium]